jgi:hypothetical protein
LQYPLSFIVPVQVLSMHNKRSANSLIDLPAIIGWLLREEIYTFW